jgi:hypothetical protein
VQGSVAGAAGGALATVPMTVVMTALRRELPGARRQEIPPRQITRRVLARAGVAKALDSEQISAATYGAHVGYGAALGAAYPAFASRLDGPPALKGALFGLLVWGGSYLGWLPAAGILRSAVREPAGRNVMMIGAHLVWGAATALVFEALRGDASDARRSRRQAAAEPDAQPAP